MGSEMCIRDRRCTMDYVPAAASIVAPQRRKKKERAILRRCLRHPTFSHFSRTPTCDRHTDRQTQGHGIYCESRARTVKINGNIYFISLQTVLCTDCSVRMVYHQHLMHTDVFRETTFFCLAVYPKHLKPISMQFITVVALKLNTLHTMHQLYITNHINPVSYTHLTLPTNREV